MAVTTIRLANHQLPDPNKRPKMEATLQPQYQNIAIVQHFIDVNDKRNYPRSMLAQSGGQGRHLQGSNYKVYQQPISGHIKDDCGFPTPIYTREPLHRPNYDLLTPLRPIAQQGSIHHPFAQIVGSPTSLRTLGNYAQSASYMVPLPPTYGSCGTPIQSAMSPGLMALSLSISSQAPHQLFSPLSGLPGGYAGSSPPFLMQRSSRVNSLESTSTGTSCISTDDGSSLGLVLQFDAIQSKHPTDCLSVPTSFTNGNATQHVSNVRDYSEGRVSNLELSSRKRAKKKKCSLNKEKEVNKAASSRKRSSPNQSSSVNENEPLPITVGAVAQEEEVLPNQVLDSKVPGAIRLIIEFVSFGERGAIVQYWGKKRVIIPHGLKGRHRCYKQNWEFEILHSTGQAVNDDLVPITFRITDLDTSTVTEATETVEDVEQRGKNGRLIANRVLRAAMEARKEILWAKLGRETDTDKRTALRKTIKLLSPERVTQGPLAFGLQHQIVQKNLGVVIVEDKSIKVKKQKMSSC